MNSEQNFAARTSGELHDLARNIETVTSGIQPRGDLEAAATIRRLRHNLNGLANLHRLATDRAHAHARATYGIYPCDPESTRHWTSAAAGLGRAIAELSQGLAAAGHLHHTESEIDRLEPDVRNQATNAITAALDAARHTLGNCAQAAHTAADLLHPGPDTAPTASRALAARPTPTTAPGPARVPATAQHTAPGSMPVARRR